MDDSDDDLRRAIALSMETEAGQLASTNEPILIEDSDDEDLKRAIALSIQAQDTSTRPTEAAVPKETPKQTHQRLATPIDQHTPVPAAGSAGLIGLDRKAMEQERLARLVAKRARSISPPPLSRPTKVTRILDTKDVGYGITSDESAKAISNKSGTGAKVGAVTANADDSTASLQDMNLPVTNGQVNFPDGKLFKTWAFGHARTGSDIKIEEVLERRTLTTALLSSFQFDFEWLFTKVDTQRTKFQFVLSEKDGGRRRTLKTDLESLGPNVKACFPALEGNANCMHSKLMLLFHPDKLRVAIPSANLLSFDWGESGIMENTVWLIDLPRLPDGQSTPDTPFLSELRYFLTAQGLPPILPRGLDNFDFSRTAPFAFIHSITGPSFGSSLARTGLMGLSTAVRSLGLASTVPEIDMTASSIGALTDKQLSLLYSAAAGTLSATPSAEGTYLSLPPVPDAPPLDRFRIYFPSLAYVQASTGSTPSGGTIWLRRTHWTRPGFPRGAFRAFRSTRRAALLSHAKLLFARTAEGKAWVYAGSANASESAWGSVAVEKKAGHARRGEVRISCRNWEAGVLIPVDTAKEEGEEGGGMPGFGVFKDTIEGPFEVPAERLEGEPWFCDEWGHGGGRWAVRGGESAGGGGEGR